MALLGEGQGGLFQAGSRGLSTREIIFFDATHQPSTPSGILRALDHTSGPLLTPFIRRAGRRTGPGATSRAYRTDLEGGRFLPSSIPSESPPGFGARTATAHSKRNSCRATAGCPEPTVLPAVVE